MSFLSFQEGFFIKSISFPFSSLRSADIQALEEPIAQRVFLLDCTLGPAVGFSDSLGKGRTRLSLRKKTPRRGPQPPHRDLTLWEPNLPWAQRSIPQIRSIVKEGLEGIALGPDNGFVF